MEISDIKKEYASQIDALDLDLLIAHVLGKPREFILSHPEFSLSESQVKRIKKLSKRRVSHEPLAYLTGTKEFYGLNFKVNESTLIPRPETELLVELVTNKLKFETSNNIIIDVGTGSGNIIIALAKNITNKNIRYFATDISNGALRIAKQNSKLHKVDKQIKFLNGNLLNPLFKIWNFKFEISRIIILANLPYLSKEIYGRADPTVKNFEPKSALLSQEHGLSHYKQLLKQMKDLRTLADHEFQIISYLEISPEQKLPLEKIIKNTFSQAKIKLYKDWSQKWRICEIKA